MQAEMTWRGAQIVAMSSMSALRDVMKTLSYVAGDKTVILISGGWPLDDRDVTSIVSTVASETVAARVTLFTVFIPPTGLTASRRMMYVSTTLDHHLYSWPLETLAGMTGGGSFRADVGAEPAFERIAREMSGFYRIGVERNAIDEDGKGRRMRVQVPRTGGTLRYRTVFDAKSFEDRDWAARMNSALESPVPATGVGLRMTSYLTGSTEPESPINIVVSGEATRLEPGNVTYQVLIKDLEGKRVLSNEKPLGTATADGLPFTMNIPVPAGQYIVRVAVMDSAGHVGSVDHRVDARRIPLGGISATSPLFVRVPTAGAGAEPRIAIDRVRQDERLAVQVDLESERNLDDAAVTFEIALTDDGPALVRKAGAITPGSRQGAVVAQAVTDTRVLPPGSYIMRARVTAGGESGEVRRSFTLVEAPNAAPAKAAADVITTAAAPTTAPPPRLASAALPPFSLDQALAPPVLKGFMDRVSARPDAATPAMRALLARVSSADLKDIVVANDQAAAAPVAAFVQGLSLLAQSKINPAMDSFRTAMRASADFYPAMVYLGVCYAAGGNDKDAAGAFRTALIREGDALPLHTLLIDALLRQGRADMALQSVENARARWPEDDGLKRQYALASLLGEKQLDGLRAVDELIEKHAEDESTLTLALRVLYDGFQSGRPIASPNDDRARMTRLAEAYRALGGRSQALVDAWVAAVAKKP
jgi:TolA-binding protein